MSFCLPFAYYKEWQETKQQEKEDLEQPLLAAPTVSPRGGAICLGKEWNSGH
jgi:hypothetical protein